MPEVADPASKSAYVKFRSPEGFLVYPHLDVPNREFDSRGLFSAGIHLTVPELAAVEADLKAVFLAAFPDEPREPHLPLWRHPDGPITLFAKSIQRPRIVDETLRPILHATAGARVQLLCNARAYRHHDAAGVALYLNVVRVIALDARDPRRERQRQEIEALRQAVAIARAGMGSR